MISAQKLQEEVDLIIANALREDVPYEETGAADPLANAPAASEGMFEVPKIIE